MINCMPCTIYNVNVYINLSEFDRLNDSIIKTFPKTYSFYATTAIGAFKMVTFWLEKKSIFPDILFCIQLCVVVNLNPLGTNGSISSLRP